MEDIFDFNSHMPSTTLSNNKIEAFWKYVKESLDDQEKHIACIKLAVMRKYTNNFIINSQFDQHNNSRINITNTVYDITDSHLDDLLKIGKIDNNQITMDICPNINMKLRLDTPLIKTLEQGNTVILDYFIHNKIDIGTYLFGLAIDILASQGKLEYIIKIMGMHKFKNIIMLIDKICKIAICNTHINILHHYLSVEAFIGAPDYVYILFIYAIEHSDNISIIHFFIDNGVCLQQKNYNAVIKALQYNKNHFLEYFCTLDREVTSMINNYKNNILTID